MYCWEPTPEEIKQMEEQERIEREAYEEVEKLVKEWRAKWPNACDECGGWVGFHTRGTYDSPPDFDPCEREPAEECHRCGEIGLDEDGNGPCSKCGWNYNDGEPQW